MEAEIEEPGGIEWLVLQFLTQLSFAVMIYLIFPSSFISLNMENAPIYSNRYNNAFNSFRGAACSIAIILIY